MVTLGQWSLSIVVTLGQWSLSIVVTLGPVEPVYSGGHLGTVEPVYSGHLGTSGTCV